MNFSNLVSTGVASWESSNDLTYVCLHQGIQFSITRMDCVWGSRRVSTTHEHAEDAVLRGRCISHVLIFIYFGILDGFCIG